MHPAVRARPPRENLELASIDEDEEEEEEEEEELEDAAARGKAVDIIQEMHICTGYACKTLHRFF